MCSEVLLGLFRTHRRHRQSHLAIRTIQSMLRMAFRNLRRLYQPVPPAPANAVDAGSSLAESGLRTSGKLHASPQHGDAESRLVWPEPRRLAVCPC
jgi:hypothetical protein